MRIWKFGLDITDEQRLELPKGAKLLTIQVQDGDPQLWAMCDEDVSLEWREIALYGTGHPLPEDPGAYIATFQVSGGALVFHAFELPTPTPTKEIP